MKDVTIIGETFVTTGYKKEDKLYLKLSHSVLIPFECTEKYEVVEEILSIKVLHKKCKLLHKRIDFLQKRIDENFSDIYIDKYFEGLKNELKDFESIAKIKNLYVNFLRLIFQNNKWFEKDQSINSDESLSYKEKSIAKDKLFFEYVIENS